jgi:SAM-dependent methyltransferase
VASGTPSVGTIGVNPWAVVAPVYDTVMRLTGWRRIQSEFASGLCDVLDIGCGTALLSETIGAGYTGVDRELRMLRRAQGAPRLVSGDARSLPFLDNSFDIVLSTGFLGLLVPQERALVLAEMARVARRELHALEPIAGVTHARALALSRHPIDPEEFRTAGFEPTVGKRLYFGLYAPVVATLGGCDHSMPEHMKRPPPVQGGGLFA